MFWDLSCGSSDETGLADQSVDLIVTDPPFFDNVHYSELADFFHAWQSLYPRGFVASAATTRHPREVQDTRADQFAEKLRRVFCECCRVLKDGGLLVFTYHHSRPEGWSSLARAIYGAGFSAVQAHPVKAEMSVAKPKSLARDPIQLDVIFVCQKSEQDRRAPSEPSFVLEQTAAVAEDKLNRLGRLGLVLSRNDCRVTVVSQFLALLGPIRSPEVAVDALECCQVQLVQMSAAASERADAVATPASPGQPKQLRLLSYFE